LLISDGSRISNRGGTLFCRCLTLRAVRPGRRDFAQIWAGEGLSARDRDSYRN